MLLGHVGAVMSLFLIYLFSVGVQAPEKIFTDRKKQFWLPAFKTVTMTLIVKIRLFRADFYTNNQFLVQIFFMSTATKNRFSRAVLPGQPHLKWFRAVVYVAFQQPIKIFFHFLKNIESKKKIIVCLRPAAITVAITCLFS